MRTLIVGVAGVLLATLLMIDCHRYRQEVRQCAEFLKELAGEQR